MSSENNKALVERYVQAFNRGDLDAAAECFSPQTCNFGRPVGREGIRTVLEDIRQTFPDVKLETVDVVAGDDWVVERGYFSGTHLGIGKLPVNGGLLVGIPPTNRRFRVNHVHMYRVSHDQIADHYGVRDDLGMMQQLGLIPSAPGRPDQPPR